MLRSRPLINLLRCRECRFAALNTPHCPPSALRSPNCFSTVSNQHSSASWLSDQHWKFGQTAHLHTSPGRRADGVGVPGSTIEQVDTGDHATPTTDDDVPWYLRVREAAMPDTSLFEKQKLPEIPPDAPKELHNIVTHLLEGIGMESLALLDLRDMDPPPALGSNLIMIIGTARSERHLHVSADRFCRWLRATYALRPHADGLLGRGELKLKLRRRARRAKLMGSKSRPTNKDDGLTTGWVCVNAGAMGPQTGQDQAVQSVGGSVIGFGQDTGGINLVVQMLTEEKREAIQLEELWMDFSRARSRNTAVDADQEVPELISEATKGSTDVVAEDEHSGIVPATRSSTMPSETASPFINQRRSFHSLSKLATDAVPRNASHSPFAAQPPAVSFSPASSHIGSNVVGSHDPTTENSLAQRIQELVQLPPEKAREMLGNGWRDRSSTAFLSTFFEEIGQSPRIDQYRHWLRLVEHGIAVGHQGYSVANMLRILQEMQESLIVLPEDVFTLIIAQLAEAASSLPSLSSASQHIDSVSAMIELLQDMNLRQLDIHSQEIVDALFRIVRAAKDDNSQHVHPEATARLAQLAHEQRRTVPTLDIHLEAVAELIHAQRWDALWELWAGFPIRTEARPAALYTAVFSHAARSQHQRGCMAVITRLVPSMALEAPPVAIAGATAAALQGCLRVADPQVEAQWQDGGFRQRPWVQLFQQCEDGLRASTA